MQKQSTNPSQTDALQETSKTTLLPAPNGPTVFLCQKLPASATPNLTGCVILLIEPKPFWALTYDNRRNRRSLSPCALGKRRQHFSGSHLVFYLQTACLQHVWLLVFPEYWSVDLSNLSEEYNICMTNQLGEQDKNLHYLMLFYTFYHQFRALL